MVVHNNDIRLILDDAKKEGIYKYHIAYELGVSESTFARYFRKQLSEIMREKILKVIEYLKTQK